MAGRLTRRGLLSGAWLRPGPAAPVDWVAVHATAGRADDAAKAVRGTAPRAGAATDPAGRRPTVTIDPSRCLPFCQVCVERCPVPGALSVAGRGPVVNPAACNGCGLCASVCPSPAQPLSDFPTRPS